MMPRGFDLNAPVAEDLDLDEHESEREKAMLATEEADCQEQIEDASKQGMTIEGVIDGCSKDEADSSQHHSSIAVPAFFQQCFELAGHLSIDEDLDIICSVWKSFKDADAETLDNTLAEACKELAKAPGSPNKYYYLSCIYVSKKLPESFSLPKTFKALLNLLSINAVQLTAKRQSMLPMLASKLLVRAFDAQLEWPIDFIEVYLADAIGPRCWVDHEGCKELVMNISTAFTTKPWDLEGQPLKKESASSLAHPETTAVKNRYRNEEVRMVARQKFIQALYQLLGNASIKENPRQLISEFEEAWLWLQKILSHEPDLTTRIPLLWQCQLLHKCEGLPPDYRKNVINLGYVKSSLCKMIIQGSAAQEVEIDETLEFLSQKLASPCNAIRSQSRRCFAGIFSPSISKELIPLQTSKKMSLAHPGEAIVAEFPNREDLSWLDNIDQILSLSTLINIVVRNICAALQKETSLTVVISYLSFLKKHLPPPPSPLSLVCCLAKLAVHRKMLTKTLLLGVKKSSNCLMHEIPSPSGSMLLVVDLFLNSINEALKTGVIPFSDIQVPMVEEYVMLISPCYSSERMDQTLLRVKIQKIIVDAAVEIISLVASAPDDSLRSHIGYEELLNFFFPGFILPNYHRTSQGSSIAWIEMDSENQLPLLSERQALNLARSKDPRLVNAGLSVLPPRMKIQLCSGLGLSSTAATALLQELDYIAGARLELFQKLGSFTAREAAKLKGHLSLLANFDNNKGSHFVQLLPDSSAYLPSSKIIEQTSIPSITNDVENRGERNIVIEDVVKHVFFDLPTNFSLTLFSSYFYLRKFLQESNFCPAKHNSQQVFRVFTAICDVLRYNKTCGLPLFMVIRLYIPLLVSFIGFKMSLSHLHKKNKCCNLNEKVQTAIRGVCQWVDSELNNISARLQDSSNDLLIQVTSAVKEIFCAIQPQQIEDREWIRVVEKYKNQPFVWHDERAGAFIESGLHKLMHLHLNEIVEENDVKSDIGESLLGRLIELVHKWKLRIFCESENKSCKDDFKIPKFPDFKTEIAVAGCHSLAVAFLKILIPKSTMIQHLESIFSILLVPLKGLEGYDFGFVSHNFPGLLLQWIVHESSWVFSTQVFEHLLKDVILLFFGRKQVSHFANNYIDEVTRTLRGLILFKQLLAHAGALLEFVSCLLHHPHSILSQYADGQTNSHETSTNLMSSIRTSAVVRSISDLAVIINSVSKIIIQAQKSSVSSNKAFPNGDSTEKFMLCQYGKIVLKVLSALSRNPQLLHGVLQELYKWEQGICFERLDNVVLNHPEFKSVARIGARELLWRLYLAFPMCVDVNRVYGIDKEASLKQLAFGLSIHSGIGFYYGQSSFATHIIHRSLLCVFKGSGKEADIAYGICHHFARQHPVLFLPHVPLLSILLKELLPGVRGETDVRNQVARALSVGLSLLHALRPHLFLSGTDNENLDVDINIVSKSNWHFSAYLHLKNIVDSSVAETFDRNLLTKLFDGLESLLSVYFDFLRTVEAEDAPHFAKVVARLADFLCHCVASDTHFHGFIASGWGTVLNNVAGKFSKIKKLSFLLSLLDSSSNNQHLETGAMVPPTLPLEVIEKVKQKLLYFSCLEQKGSSEHKSRTRDISWEDWDQREIEESENVDGSDLLSNIADLENASARLPTILPILEDTLIQLTQLNDTNIRERIYCLLERLLVECPSEESAKKVGENLVRQLSSPNTTVSRVAASQVARFFCYCSDHQELILLQMFQLRQSSGHLLELIEILLSFN